MKILVAYAYAGIGHKKAALAVEKALSAFKNAEVKTIDALDYTNAFFKFSYPRFYLFLTNRTPTLWGFFYYLLDFKAVDFFMAPVRRFLDRTNSRKLIEFVKETQPDAIVCTHFSPGEIISGMKAKGEFKGRLITVVTDFIPHSFWMARWSDYFIGAIQRTKTDLLRRGISEQKIRIMGIPCDPVFSISKGRDMLVKKLGIEQGFFNVLIMSGGFGTGPIREIVDNINNLEAGVRGRLQLIVICGKNQVLFQELSSIAKELKIKIKVFGYMDNVDEFMEISDLIVTKPGGLTISEALSKNLPMIIVQPIPGQETRNCKILVGYGTAVRANNAREVSSFIKEFVCFPERIIGTRTRAKLLAYPDAARAIADFIVGLDSGNDSVGGRQA
jgi:processive 1,2-diacylglycerol beta-glucosyltransferase